MPSAYEAAYELTLAILDDLNTEICGRHDGDASFVSGERYGEMFSGYSAECRIVRNETSFCGVRRRQEHGSIAVSTPTGKVYTFSVSGECDVSEDLSSR